MTLATTMPANPHDGWMQSSTCRAAHEAGLADGRAYGLAEGTARKLAGLLARQARQKFGGGDETGRATLDGLALALAKPILNDLAERLLTATHWSDWLADVVVPPLAPDMPEYAKNMEIDLEESGPSIDTEAKVTLKNGKKAITILRLQKWHQPNLDRHLYERSRKLERQHGLPCMVAVILMWPPAEGPGVTGKYVANIMGMKRTFTYHIRRAWEMEPEETMGGPGTMVLAPLTKGSKARMPEIVQMMKRGLDAYKADARIRDMVWECAYWAMGLICDLDECHRALGDVTATIQKSKGYLRARGTSFFEGYSPAVREGELAAARELVLRQATARFGVNAEAAEALAKLTAPEDLEALAHRVLTAADWASLSSR